jgi:YaiO family outer membrane protein
VYADGRKSYADCRRQFVVFHGYDDLGRMMVNRSHLRRSAQDLRGSAYRRVAVAATLLALSAHAQERPPFEFRLEGAKEKLDHGYEDWSEALAQLAWRPARGQAFAGAFRATERFGLRDREGLAAAYLPIGEGGTNLHVEGTASSTHRVLPKGTVLAELAQPLGSGWVVGGGGKLSRYTDTDVTTFTANVDKYLGEWRLGYTAYLSRPEGAAWGPSHRLVAAWYRSELRQASFSIARGREQENIPPLGIVTSDVRNATLNAVFEVAPRWGLTFEWAWHEQGDLYTRRTVRLGTRLLF